MLINEYMDFVSKWNALRGNPTTRPTPIEIDSSSSDYEGDYEGDDKEHAEEKPLDGVVPHGDGKCNNCVTSVFGWLNQYKAMNGTYPNLYIVYKYLLTIATTQVECERSFSKLKIIKTRLRQTISDSNLESFMLMACEPKLLDKLLFNDIITQVCQNQKSLSSYFFM